jgi:serine/threonine protein kinase
MTEETIFLGAIEKQDPTERIAYLDEACAGDSELRARVEALLASHQATDSFLDVPAALRQAEARPPASAAGKSPTPEELALLGPPRAPGALGSLDHYDVLELAGRGGMGVVFKAVDTKLKRVVAIKVLAPQMAAVGASRARFIREAQAAAAIRDTHVVSIHAVIDERPVPYLVMEYIGGITLDEQVRLKGPFALKEILRIGMQAAEGLAAAHRQGLVHRDVKPSNILLENGVQRVKVTDFGLARAADNATLTQSGIIAGTPLYMSPEQARGERLDHRSDLFSLGSVLYTMCTGWPAFSAGNTVAVLKRVCEDTPRPIRQLNPDIPDWLAGIVTRLQAKDPAARFQSAAEVAELLGERLAALQHSGPMLPSATSARSRRKPAVLIAALLVLGLAAAGSYAVYSWLSARSHGPVPGQLDQAKPAPPVPVAVPPNVLTVSQRPEDGGQLRTITDAVEQVKPGMIIRVMDAEVYLEQLNFDREHRYKGVVLEAAPGKRPTLRLPPNTPVGQETCIQIGSIPNFTVRGFRIDPGTAQRISVDLVLILGKPAGLLLEDLELDTGIQPGSCLAFMKLALSPTDAPVIVQNSSFHGMNAGGLGVYGRPNRQFDKPLPCANLIIRNNAFVNCAVGVSFLGSLQRILVVGNRIRNCRTIAIDIRDLLAGTEDILITNNTLLGNRISLQVWDDAAKHDVVQVCKRVHFRNNLVLEPDDEGDLFFCEHELGNPNQFERSDAGRLVKSDGWRFSHNWREIDKQAAAKDSSRIISAGDTLLKPIPGIGRDPAAADFLRPAKDSPLANGGLADPALPLPRHVGALPPEGTPTWDWEQTWKALTRPSQK